MVNWAFDVGSACADGSFRYPESLADQSFDNTGCQFLPRFGSDRAVLIQV